MEPDISWSIGDGVINGVIMAAVWSVDRAPGVQQKMIHALSRGASTTKEGTASAFLFRAMVDRLLEEFHALESSFAD